jgi:hypothetical protein
MVNHGPCRYGLTIDKIEVSCRFNVNNSRRGDRNLFNISRSLFHNIRYTFVHGLLQLS